MPIRPENRNRYPKDWKTRIVPHIRDRAGDKCEICGVPNHTWIVRNPAGEWRLAYCMDEEGAVFIVCTTMHLDHTPENCADDNLKFACQKCHNSYDAKHRAQGKKERRFAENLELPL